MGTSKFMYWSWGSLILSSGADPNQVCGIDSQSAIGPKEGRRNRLGLLTLARLHLAMVMVIVSVVMVIVVMAMVMVMDMDMVMMMAVAVIVIVFVFVFVSSMIMSSMIMIVRRLRPKIVLARALFVLDRLGEFVARHFPFRHLGLAQDVVDDLLLEDRSAQLDQRIGVLPEIIDDPAFLAGELARPLDKRALHFLVGDGDAGALADRAEQKT